MLGSQKALVYKMTGFCYNFNLIFKLVFIPPGKNNKFALWSWKLWGGPKQWCLLAVADCLFVENVFPDNQK